MENKSLDMKRFSELPHANQVCECMKLIYNRGLTTSSGGNVSVKDDDGFIWMTPSVIEWIQNNE